MDTILTVFAVAARFPNGALWGPKQPYRFPAGTYAIVCCREVPSTAAIDLRTRRTLAT